MAIRAPDGANKLSSFSPNKKRHFRISVNCSIILVTNDAIGVKDQAVKMKNEN